MFYVQKILATGVYRFGARRRRELSSIDAEPDLSTGPSGEFVRHRDEVFYSADHRPIRKAELPKPRSIATTPFWSTLVDRTPRGWGSLAAMILGAIILLLGVQVLMSKGAQGWVEIIVGLALLGLPVVLTAQKRHAIHTQEQRLLAERQERDDRDRQLLAAYSDALDRMREDPSDANLDLVRREREKLDVSYGIWSDAAVSTVLQVGFNALAQKGAGAAKEIAALMDRASGAAGLVKEDATGAKHALYATVLWHLIADDRLGESQRAVVRSIQHGFAIAPEDVPVETSSEDQFDRLRGIDHRNVPRCEASIKLLPREYCLYQTSAEGAPAPSNIIVTNYRLILGSGKKNELKVPDIDQIEVDADAGSVTIRTVHKKRGVTLRLPDPIFFASILSLATSLDERPNAFS